MAAGVRYRSADFPRVRYVLCRRICFGNQNIHPLDRIVETCSIEQKRENFRYGFVGRIYRNGNLLAVNILIEKEQITSLLFDFIYDAFHRDFVQMNGQPCGLRLRLGC